MTRLEMIKRKNQPLGFPEISAGDYLLQALFDVGPTEYDSSGEFVPLLWSTLYHYAKSTDEISEPWEFKALRKMSVGYVEGRTAGVDPFCKVPALWNEEPEEPKEKE